AGERAAAAVERVGADERVANGGEAEHRGAAIDDERAGAIHQAGHGVRLGYRLGDGGVEPGARGGQQPSGGFESRARDERAQLLVLGADRDRDGERAVVAAEDAVAEVAERATVERLRVRLGGPIAQA